MQIYEIKRPDSISFKFTNERGSWLLSTEDMENEIKFTEFCIDLCQKAKLRELDNHNPYFTEQEVSLLIKYFRIQNFIIDRRDTVLEHDLKEVIKLVGGDNKNNLLESIDYISYNQQTELMAKLAEILE